MIAIYKVQVLICSVVDKKTATQSESKKPVAADPAAEGMEVETKSRFNKKTMKDEHGQYPEWMSKRRIRKHKQSQGKKVKRGKKKGVMNW